MATIVYLVYTKTVDSIEGTLYWLVKLWISFAIYLWAIQEKMASALRSLQYQVKKSSKSIFVVYIISLFWYILKLFTSASMAGSGSA